LGKALRFLKAEAWENALEELQDPFSLGNHPVGLKGRVVDLTSGLGRDVLQERIDSVKLHASPVFIDIRDIRLHQSAVHRGDRGQ
jgi:hypothetical protein